MIRTRLALERDFVIAPLAHVQVDTLRARLRPASWNVFVLEHVHSGAH
jgi:hypothetical protein